MCSQPLLSKSQVEARLHLRCGGPEATSGDCYNCRRGCESLRAFGSGRLRVRGSAIYFLVRPNDSIPLQQYTSLRISPVLTYKGPGKDVAPLLLTDIYSFYIQIKVSFGKSHGASSNLFVEGKRQSWPNTDPYADPVPTLCRPCVGPMYCRRTRCVNASHARVGESSMRLCLIASTLTA